MHTAHFTLQHLKAPTHYDLTFTIVMFRLGLVVYHEL
jgi:hypothetical protein